MLLLVGIGEPLKYILIAKAALVPIALNTLQGFRQVPDALREVGPVYGYSRRQEVLEVVLPHGAPTLFTGVRLGFTKAWLSLVVVELVASSEGLGYLIVYGRQLFQLDLVMAAVIVVGAIGYAIDRLLERSSAMRPSGSAGVSRPGAPDEPDVDHCRSARRQFATIAGERRDRVGRTCVGRRNDQPARAASRGCRWRGWVLPVGVVALWALASRFD